MKTMTRGEVALRTGVNIETVRYHEQRGLIPEPPRSASGYRTYTEDYVTEQELQVADAQIMGVVAQVDERLEGIERRLNANAAAARAETEEREIWKTELAANYLPQETTDN